ncbi:MAG: formylglycine-generating enzyme family protein [Pirellulales bacterium]
MRSLERWQYRPDETPVVTHRRVGAFALNKYPTLNAWYRLYDPDHGLRGDNQALYERISGDPNTPAIFVSWYDAWAFCRWASWDGECCRLPHEDEWEYACKACDQCTEHQPCANGGPCDWNYWWGDGFLQARCTANQPYATGSTTPPASHDRDGPTGHRNARGLVDMNGNVWEWTDDTYRERYERTDTTKASPSAARVLRGGSWSLEPLDVRSSLRLDFHPSYSDGLTGFRVCRVVCVARGSS